MLAELSPSLTIAGPLHTAESGQIFYVVQKDGHGIAGLVRSPKQWVLSFDQGDPLTFSKTAQVVRFLNQAFA